MLAAARPSESNELISVTPFLLNQVAILLGGDYISITFSGKANRQFRGQFERFSLTSFSTILG
jgi:hypothetical protein